MKFIWLSTTREAFNNIRSRHFTDSETIEYKYQLLDRIEKKIDLLRTSLPVNKFGWNNSHKIMVDRYIVYYSFSEDREVCYIEYFKHSSQF
jgi:hypothetical protein